MVAKRCHLYEWTISVHPCIVRDKLWRKKQNGGGGEEGLLGILLDVCIEPKQDVMFLTPSRYVKSINKG